MIFAFVCLFFVYQSDQAVANEPAASAHTTTPRVLEIKDVAEKLKQHIPTPLSMQSLAKQYVIKETERKLREQTDWMYIVVYALSLSMATTPLEKEWNYPYTVTWGGTKKDVDQRYLDAEYLRLPPPTDETLAITRQTFLEVGYGFEYIYAGCMNVTCDAQRSHYSRVFPLSNLSPTDL